MMRTCLLFLMCLIGISHSHAAENILWSGEVKADGTPSSLITLKLHHPYQIKVKGFVNLGKWIQQGEELASDACYEFNKEHSTSKVESIKNSGDISVCDGHYHPDHIYLSQKFVAKQDRIHFWVSDHYYDDNHGAFQVEILELDPAKNAETNAAAPSEA